MTNVTNATQKKSETDQPSAPILPPVGLSRWSQLEPLIPITKETWRKLGLAGKAPAPIRMGERCTFYQNAEVLKWIADPLNYTQDAA